MENFRSEQRGFSCISSTDQLSYSSCTDKKFPVKRPDNGGTEAIRSTRLQANHFILSYNPESIISHYDVDVKPENPAKNGSPVKMSKYELSAIRKKLFSDNPSDFPLLSTAYDGGKNIFSAVPLPTGSFKVEVPAEEDTQFSSYRFTLKLVNELKLCKLKEYLSGHLLSIPGNILQGMHLMMKENPTRCLVSVGRCFYPRKSNENDDLGHGAAAFRGFWHSLRLTSQGPALCLDYSAVACHKCMPVIDFLQEQIRGFTLEDFTRLRREVEDVLRGLKVTVTHRKTKQKYIIKGLTCENAGDITFDAVDIDGQCPPRKVRLLDYFSVKYQEIQYKNIPCLDLGKNGGENFTPMEFCVLAEGQKYATEHLHRNAAIKLKDIAMPLPGIRQQNIREMVESNDGPCGGGIIGNFGIVVNKVMTPVTGRVIVPPELKLRASNGKIAKVTVHKEKFDWTLVGKSLVEGKRISCWAVLDFSSFEQFCLDSEQFIPKLISKCNKVGIRMGEPVLYKAASMKPFTSVQMIRQQLESIKEQAYKRSEGRLQLLVCVMARRDPGYKYLKWISETQIGIVTQCCLSGRANKANDEYLSYLALKINAKLGGSNVELSDRLPLFRGAGHVMFVGADVNHPATQNTISPSIAAVVATVNWPAANRYAARIRPQFCRMEKILNFGDMCLELVETYERLNKVKPDKIVVFRDGVGEGQFDMVLNEELLDLKRALGGIKYYPTITLIVAQKRHHTRLFPESSSDGNSRGNVLPGTVVDTIIVHPFEFDFYLCSHYGALGTSKPIHYHVLWDEHRFTSDQLQKLIYDLCFTSARCTKPVSLVPPVYYADLVAYRGRLYHDSMEDQSPASASSSSSSSSASSPLPGAYYKLHADLENIMFFI
ncbi:protein argonaute 2-like [Prunus yedoensis var. nudiflora]|uniref:Protein argonaute 2-like n=1 Tax=Prunus yedoensis var. nudiflora TaxID=2094558 RepID=A0A314V0L6_PRUYE|nr:protein argonaute 2-like [Prunus yedoensis var. nudiflora]